uniref:Protein kinase domain-containing protein n=1 Tax=Moniliophthora roreri TaxID=221103 RepID=A0A0W0F905_MONRR
MDCRKELKNLQIIFQDETAYRELLDQKGRLAQSLLDLLQHLIDAPDITNQLRASICNTMLRLSRASDLYPSCLAIQNVKIMGRHPVAGGGFGDIWRGSLGEGKQVVCLKVVKMYLMSDVKRLLKEYMQEAIVWRQLKHPNVLPCLGLYYLDDSHERLCLISPWMENGNLVEFLQAHPQESIDRFQLMHDVANGLSYLHSLKIIHGDLKGVNILMTPSRRACIADFGLCRVADSQVFKITSSTCHARGTARWSAPEILMGNRTSAESDIYAYGCVCYEIIAGLQPFHEKPNDAAVALAVWQGMRPSRPLNMNLHDDLWSLLMRCWESDPRSRPSPEELLMSLAELNPAINLIPDADSWDTQFSTLSKAIQRQWSPPDALFTRIRECLAQYAARTDSLAYLRELCMLTVTIDTAVKASVHHKDILSDLNERVYEVVYLLVCTCGESCRDVRKQARYMNDRGTDLMKVLQDIKKFVLNQNGPVGMLRYRLYGPATVQSYISLLYQALAPFDPPPEAEIRDSVRILAAVSSGWIEKPTARDLFARNNPLPGSPDISLPDSKFTQYVLTIPSSTRLEYRKSH